MRVYLAGAWGRREEILRVANRLRHVGVEITSNWLTEEAGMQSGSKERFLRERAYIDLQDVDRADALVRFADISRTRQVPRALISGARMFEMGYAKAKGKTLIVVGGKQHVFDRLAEVIHVKDADALVRLLKQ
jgi:nucleoside 2-deoxyribosyltransferase